jgi:hypothetical protein
MLSAPIAAFLDTRFRRIDDAEPGIDRPGLSDRYSWYGMLTMRRNAKAVRSGLIINQC